MKDIGIWDVILYTIIYNKLFLYIASLNVVNISINNSIIISILKYYQRFVKEIISPKEKQWVYDSSFKQEGI